MDKDTQALDDALLAANYGDVQYIGADFAEELQHSRGFIPVHQYASMIPLDGEVGSIGKKRFVVLQQGKRGAG